MNKNITIVLISGIVLLMLIFFILVGTPYIPIEQPTTKTEHNTMITIMNMSTIIILLFVILRRK